VPIDINEEVVLMEVNLSKGDMVILPSGSKILSGPHFNIKGESVMVVLLAEKNWINFV
jgi:hypothetical protein